MQLIYSHSNKRCLTSVMSKAGTLPWSIGPRPTVVPSASEELAVQLVRLDIDVILARGTPAILAAKKGKRDYSRRHDGERKPVHLRYQPCTSRRQCYGAKQPFLGPLHEKG